MTKETDNQRAVRHRELLGMPFGTANARLRKAILFSLVQQTERDKCHRCNLVIASIDHLSIEHKTPWERGDSPSEMFFSLENIAFSHLSCNVAASNKPLKKYASSVEKEAARHKRRYPRIRDEYNARRRPRRRKPRPEQDQLPL